MELLKKLEEFINQLLIRLTPKWVDRFFERCEHYRRLGMTFVLSLPPKFLLRFQQLKGKLSAIDYRSQIQAAYQRAKESSPGASKLRSVLTAPFIIMAHWFQGLSVPQAMLLLTLSSASVLAGISIIFSGQRIARQFDTHRAPASAEELEAYERPDYYKEERRHFLVTSLRLPVYYAQINEIKSVDIDFTATLSNRFARQYLEKMEWQLRDHLILEMEPLVATFAIEDEGKDVLRDKLTDEINRFLMDRKVEAQVDNLEITYILAN